MSAAAVVPEFKVQEGFALRRHHADETLDLAVPDPEEGGSAIPEAEALGSTLRLKKCSGWSAGVPSDGAIGTQDEINALRTL